MNYGTLMTAGPFFEIRIGALAMCRERHIAERPLSRNNRCSTDRLGHDMDCLSPLAWQRSICLVIATCDRAKIIRASNWYGIFRSRSQAGKSGENILNSKTTDPAFR
jgi:hypothetical protein